LERRDDNGMGTENATFGHLEGDILRELNGENPVLLIEYSTTS
jgi:hypothetical protein